jgi:hypothetical protein
MLRKQKEKVFSDVDIYIHTKELTQSLLQSGYQKSIPKAMGDIWNSLKKINPEKKK